MEKNYYHTFDLGKRKVVLCARLYECFLGSPELDIGMSVCMPGDEYNEERGYNIARAGAKKRAKIVFSCDWEEIDKYIINGLLLGVEKSIRRNPGKYIASYHKRKHNLIKEQKI